MSDLMKGNFKPKRKLDASKEEKETLEQRFEREAMKRLGGSICFVSKKKVAWDLQGSEPNKSKEPPK
jgi:hypothetical protein